MIVILQLYLFVIKDNTPVWIPASLAAKVSSSCTRDLSSKFESRLHHGKGFKGRERVTSCCVAYKGPMNLQ